MNDHDGPVSVLSPEQSLARMQTLSVGRIVTNVQDVIDIFPVNYVIDDGDVVLRTAEGTKMTELVISKEVLFEVDQHTDIEAWSVVVRGKARVLQTEAEILVAETLPLKPLVPTVKRNFVRITPTQISGRAFKVAPEPSRDGPQDY